MWDFDKLNKKKWKENELSEKNGSIKIETEKS